MNWSTQSAAVALLLCVLPACSKEAPTIGDLGRTQIAYRFSSAIPCQSLGIGLDRPTLVGGSEPICLLPHGDATMLPMPLAADSSDATVFDVLPGGPQDPALVLTLRAHAVGSAKLILKDSETGALFDTTTVRVAEATSLKLDLTILTAGAGADQSSDVGEVVLHAGQTVGLQPRVFDDAGDELAAWHSVHATVADANVVSLSPDESEDDTLAQSIQPILPGSTTLTLQVGPIQRSWPVRVE